MGIVEHDHHRVVACHPIHQCDEARLHVLDERSFVALLRHPEQERQALGCLTGLLIAAHPGHQLLEQAEDLVGVVTRCDAGEVAHDRRDG